MDPLSISLTLPAKSRRRAVQKSFFGCASCKARKIKCDETKPGCLRCRESSKKCPGFSVGTKLRWSRKHELYPDRRKSVGVPNNESMWPSSYLNESLRPKDTLLDEASPKTPSVMVISNSNKRTHRQTSRNSVCNGKNTEENHGDLVRSGASFAFRETDSPLRNGTNDSVDCEERTNLYPDELQWMIEDPQSEGFSTLRGISLQLELSEHIGEPPNDSRSCFGQHTKSLPCRHCRNESSNGVVLRLDSSVRDHICRHSLYKESDNVPAQLTDLCNVLVKFYFTTVCPIFSTFDSQQNLFRTFVEKRWQRSSAIYYAILSMAAAKLSRHTTRLRALALYHQSQALRHLKEDVSKSTAWNTELLFVVLMLGLSTAWHDVADLGLAHLKAMQQAVLECSIDCPGEESDMMDFFREALVYWEMVTSLMNERISIHDYSKLGLPTTKPPSLQGCPNALTKPHPWTSIASLPQALFTRLVRLIQQQRSLERREMPATKYLVEQAEILQAVRLIEKELWTFELPTLHDIASTGDDNTPASHHLLLAEAYVFANLYQLYRAFPDLRREKESNSSTEIIDMFSEGHSRLNLFKSYSSCFLDSDVGQEVWSTFLGRNIIHRLEQIPTSSGTSCVQPLLLLIASTSLSTTSQRNKSEENGEVIRLRKFVVKRLAHFSISFLSEPIHRVELAVKEVFRRLDLGEKVFWMDMLHSLGLVTIIGLVQSDSLRRKFPDWVWFGLALQVLYQASPHRHGARGVQSQRASEEEIKRTMPASVQTLSTTSGKVNGTANGDGDNESILEGNFPSTWYTEPRFYEFERRAIFSKHWLLTTHRLRLPEPGSYLRFEMAGFDFFLVKNKDHEIKAFHNVCRHRAYPLLDEGDAGIGKKSIFSCGYHGWSYNLNGKLTKAPKFDELQTFHKDQYSLFEIHTHVDKMGFVWVNFDSSKSPISWDVLNHGTDEQPRFKDFALDDYVYHRTWTTNGKYNWKLVGENYNECYHCKVSHPGITKITNLERYSVEPHAGRFEHFPPNRDDIKPEDFEYFGNGAFTYDFPNTSVNLSTPYFFIMRVRPTSATTVVTEYQTFRNPAADLDVFQRAADFFEGIELEDYDLCNGVQQSLNRGAYVQGPLHTKRESGVLYFKQLVRQQLKAHFALESREEQEVWPARRYGQLHGAVQEEEEFCAAVCGQRGKTVRDIEDL